MLAQAARLQQDNTQMTVVICSNYQLWMHTESKTSMFMENECKQWKNK